MLVCPRCGIKVTNPTKTWSMIGKPNNTGEQFKLGLGFLMCLECEKRFMKLLDKEKERVNLKGAVEEIKDIEKGLTQMLGDLRKKIEKLKNERTELLEEIEELKKEGEKKASTLEEEIASLKEEVESLKEMLDENE